MSFDELPFCIELGDAESEHVGFFGFGGGGATVIFTSHVALLPEPATLKTYVPVVETWICFDPAVAETEPIPLLIDAEDA